MTFIPISPGTSRLTLLPLRLYRFDVPTPSPAAREESGDEHAVRSVRNFANGIHPVPVVDGYVIAIPSSTTSGSGTVSSAPVMADAIVAGTDSVGRIDAAITPYFDAEASVLFTSGTEYQIFWTYSRTALNEVMSALGTEGPTAAVFTRYGFRTYVLEPEDLFRTELTFRLLSPTTPPPELLALFRALSDSGMGYVRVDTSGERHRIDPHEPAFAIVDRTGPLLAMYAAEFASLYAAATAAQTMSDQSRLHRVEQMIAVEQAGEPPADVESTLGTFDPRNADVLAEYRSYALACAREPRISTLVYRNSLQVYLISDSPWSEAVATIASYGIDHPVRNHPRERVIIGDQFVQVFEFYFDYYRLAIRERTHHYLNALRQSVQACDEALAAITNWISTLVQARLVHAQFLTDLDLHLPSDWTPRRRLMDRYVAVCSCVEYRFWEGMTVALTQSAELVTRLQWMATGAGGFGDVLEHFWESHLHKYHLTSDQVETFLNDMFRYHSAATGTEVHTIAGGDVTLTINYDTGSIHVDGDVLDTSPLREFRFARRTDDIAAGEFPAAPRLRRYMPESGPTEAFTYHVPVGLEETHWAPRGLQLVSQILNLGLAVNQLTDELQRRNVSTWITLAQNTMELAESVGIIAGAMLRRVSAARLDRLLSVTGAAGTVATFIDAGMMAYEGGTILFSPAGSVSVALQRHDPVQARWMTARGAVLLVGGGGSLAGTLIAAAAGVSLATAAVPVGIATTVAGLIVLGIDVAVYSQTGGPSQLEDFDTAFLTAKRDEFYRGEAPETDDAPVSSRTAGRLWGLHQNLVGLTTQ